MPERTIIITAECVEEELDAFENDLEKVFRKHTDRMELKVSIYE